jgi:hypothetical protein
MADNIERREVEINVNTNAEQASRNINTLNDSLETTQTRQQATARNTQQLADNLRELDSPIVQSVSNFKSMAKAMLAIVMTPLGAVLTAIALVVGGLVSIFKTFVPLLDKLEQGFNALGAVFNVVKNGFLSVFTGAKSLSEAFSGMGDDMGEAARRTVELTKAQQDLDDVMKSQELTTARNRAEINKLNVELRNRTRSEEERLKIAEEIVKKEQADFKQRERIVKEELRIAEEAIAIKAQFSDKELKQLRKTGDAMKELAESRGGTYDEEFDRLNAAKLKMIALEDEATTNIEKAYNRRDKLEDDQKAKADKIEADRLARIEKAKAAREAEAQKIEAERKAQFEKDFAFAKEQAEMLRKIEEEKKERDRQVKEEEQAELDAELTRDIERIKKRADEEKAIELALQKQKEELQVQRISLAEKGVALIAQIFGKNKKILKATMIAESAISIGKTVASTLEANAKAVAATPLTAGQPFVALNTAQAVVGIASTIASTQKALQSLGGGSAPNVGNGALGASGGGASQPQVSFQASSENQIATATANNINQQPPIQAFVVESEVTTAQSLANNRITANSL